MKDHKTFRQQLKEQLNKFKRKLRANPQTKSANSPEIPPVSLTENDSSSVTFALASDQLYEHVLPRQFQSLSTVQNFPFGNSNARHFGRRLDRSVSYDSLSFSASTMSELTSIADQSLDETLLQPIRSWDRSSIAFMDYPKRSLSLHRNYLKVKGSPITPSSIEKEPKYLHVNADQSSREIQLTPRVWNSPNHLNYQPKSNDQPGVPSRKVKRQLSFSESVPTPPQYYNRLGSNGFPRDSRGSNTLNGTAMDTYATEMIKRMLSRYNDSHSPVSTDSSIEISRSSVRRHVPFGLVNNSPATSWSTNSRMGYQNYYYNSPVDMYATSPTTSSLSSILPPPLNTPNPSPDGNQSDVDCILAPPEAFRDDTSAINTTKSVGSES